MVRTQIQLTEEQAERLKRAAVARRRSAADLIRESLDRFLAEEPDSREQRLARAARVFGRFRSGRGDLARRHDDHFADAAGER